MANEIAKKLGLKPEQLVDVARGLKLNILEQSGFYKVMGAEGRQLYIGKGKVCTRVDLSGFTSEFDTKIPDQGVFGNVKQQMVWNEGDTAEDIFRRVGGLLEHMMSLPAVEPKPKKEKVAKAPKAAKGETQTGSATPAEQLTPEERAARLDKIKAYAAETGASVSKKTLEELGGAEATQPVEPTAS